MVTTTQHRSPVLISSCLIGHKSEEHHLPLYQLGGIVTPAWIILNLMQSDLAGGKHCALGCHWCNAGELIYSIFVFVIQGQTFLCHSGSRKSWLPCLSLIRFFEAIAMEQRTSSPPLLGGSHCWSRHWYRLGQLSLRPWGKLRYQRQFHLNLSLWLQVGSARGADTKDRRSLDDLMATTVSGGSSMEEKQRAVTKELTAVFQDIPLSNAPNSLEDRWTFSYYSEVCSVLNSGAPLLCHQLALQAVLGKEALRRVSQWLQGAAVAKSTGFTFNFWGWQRCLGKWAGSSWASGAAAEWAAEGGRRWCRQIELTNLRPFLRFQSSHQTIENCFTSKEDFLQIWLCWVLMRTAQQEEESVVARNTDGSIQLRLDQVRKAKIDQVRNWKKQKEGFL